jgi:hypothetical protein
MLALLPELIVEMRAAAADLERPARLFTALPISRQWQPNCAWTSASDKNKPLVLPQLPARGAARRPHRIWAAGVSVP